MSRFNRPVLLEALCLLSFAGSGTAFLIYLAASVFRDAAQTFILKYSSLYTTAMLPSYYFLLFGVFHALSFWGVFRMWQLQKSGFPIYVFSQLVLFALPFIWLGSNGFSSVNMIFSTLFVTLYATQIKRMNR